MTRKRSTDSPPYDIHALLDQFDDGTVLDELNADLSAVAKAVARTGNKGSITLTIDVSGGGDKRIKLALASKAKVPRFKHGPREVYLHPDGGLRDHHPEQKTIAFDATPERAEPAGDM